MLFNYVVLHVCPPNEPARDIPVLVPVQCAHLDARQVHRGGRIISAGQVELTAENNNLVVNCYGSAESLGVQSRKELDDELFREAFRDDGRLPV